MAAVHVRVAIRDATLESAIERHLSGEPGLSFAPSIDAARVIIGTASDCPPSVCAQWTRAGWRVVILAAVPREQEVERYRSAGAFAYLEMTLGTNSLRETVRLASSFDNGEEVQVREYSLL